MLFATFCTNRSRFWRRSLAASGGVSCGVGAASVSERADGRTRWRDGERTFVERVVGIWLEEEVLETHHDGVEVEDGLPVLAEDVEAHVALEVEVGVVDLRERGVFRGEGGESAGGRGKGESKGGQDQV